MKRYIAIISVVIAITALLFVSCKKSNHDTLVALGDERYMKSVNEVYPQQYRDAWSTLAPPASFGDETYDVIYDGIFPPDITGKYKMEGRFVNGNDSTINNAGVHSPVLHYPQEQDVALKVISQQNGIARLEIVEAYPNMPTPSIFNIDTAYVYGNGADGTFTLVFNVHDTQLGVDDFYGMIITGTLSDDGGISNINKWKLFKKGSSHFVNGGQHCYFDDYAEREY